MNNSTTDSQYYLKYGLNKDPFPVGVIDKNIFLTPEINRRLKQAKQHISESQKLLAITSLSGAGKTLLAQKLVVLKEANWQICQLVAEENMSTESLSYAAVRQLMPGKELEPKIAISMLHKYLEISYKEKMVPVIIIDDAEKLPFETLQFVLQLADLRYNETLFRIVLFAHESLNETLAKVGLKELAEDSVDVISMPAFKADQIPAYLNYRFSHCGEGIEIPFTQEDMAYLYSATGGLAAGLNLLCRKRMIDSLQNNKTGKSYGSLSILISICILVLAGYLYYESLQLDNNTRDYQDLAQTQVVTNMKPVAQDEDVNGETATLYMVFGPEDSISLKMAETLSTVPVGELLP